MLDLLNTVDWIVPDPLAAADDFVAAFGFPAIDERWRHRSPGHRYDAAFARTHDRVDLAPTRLEFVGQRPGTVAPGCSLAPLRPITELQRGREQKSHAVMFCVGDFDAYLASLRARGVPHYVEQVCEHLPFPRAWIGWTSDEDRAPGYDAGLFIELVPTAVLGPRVAAAFDADPASVPAPAIHRRLHVVADLDAALAQLAAGPALEPTSEAHDARLGGRVATLRFRHPGSARFELLEPTGPGPAADYLAAHGDGPFLTTVTSAQPSETVRRAVERGARQVELGSGVTALTLDSSPGLLVEVGDEAGRVGAT